MSDRQINGILEDNRIHPEKVHVDVRWFPQKMRNTLSKPTKVVVFMLVMAGVAFWYSEFATWMLLAYAALAGLGLIRMEPPALKMPMNSRLPDRVQLRPTTKKLSIAEGIFFIDNDMRSGKEIWLTNGDCR